MWIQSLCFGVLAFVGISAHAASLDYNLRTVPASPVAGQPFQAVFEDNECEEFFLVAPGAAPTVQVQGNTVTVAADRIQVLDCSSDAATYSIPVPALPAGAYTIELVARAMGEPGNQVVEDTAVIQVGGGVSATPFTIPAGNGWTLTALMMLVAGVALWWRSRN